MKALTTTLAVASLLAVTLTAFAPPAAKGASVCPDAMPIVDHFESGGLFAYTVEPGLGDAVRLSGPTVVCRAPVVVPPECYMRGFATIDAIPTEMVALELSGTSVGGIPIRTHESPTRPSTGAVGPITLRCDRATGMISFARPAESFFDIFVEVELEGMPFGSQRPFEVTNTICGLPAGPENIQPCQPGAYRHTGARVGFVAGPGLPPTMHSDPSCHLPFFVPSPPPAECGSAAGSRPDGRATGATFRIFASDVSLAPATGASTTGVSYAAAHFVSVQTLPWQSSNGVWYADVVVLPTPAAPACAGGGSTPIDVKVALARGGAVSPITVHADYCVA